MAKYLQSIHKPKNWFKIVEYDKETKRATLQGPTGITFKERVTAEWLDRLGYTLVVSENPPC